MGWPSCFDRLGGALFVIKIDSAGDTRNTRNNFSVISSNNSESTRMVDGKTVVAVSVGSYFLCGVGPNFSVGDGFGF